MPADGVHDMTDRMRRPVWIHGRCYLPAEHVSRFSRRNTGYMFHNELNDADARTRIETFALFFVLFDEMADK